MSSGRNPTVSRRSFLLKSATIGAGVSSIGPSALAVTGDATIPAAAESLSAPSQKLLAKFDLTYPILQAAPGGEALAVAVANAGGMGALSLTWDYSPEQAYALIQRMNASTAGNYYANFVLHFEPANLDQVLQAGCPTIQFSWGIPDARIVDKIREAGARLGIQVSNQLSAENALQREPDFLICQGVEAGGHVQGTSPLVTTLQEVLSVVDDTPVVASGGIATGADIRRALHTGAAGVVLGTRLMATRESDAHQVYKESLVAAEAEHTVYTNCFSRDWRSACHRVLRNSTLIEWEGVGCPSVGKKPGEDDVIATHPEIGQTKRYETMPPMVGHEGDLEAMAMYAGTGVGNIDDVPDAATLIHRLWDDYQHTQ